MTDGIRGGPSGPFLTGFCGATILPMSHRSTPSRILIDRQLPVYILPVEVDTSLARILPTYTRAGPFSLFECSKVRS